MKKVYISPSMVIQYVQVTHMLAGSSDDINNVDGVEGLEMGGDTEDAGIITGNVKSNNWWGDCE